MGRYDLLTQIEEKKAKVVEVPPRKPSPPLLPENVGDEKPVVQQEQSVRQKPVRPNAPTPVRPNVRRIITRNSFETYEDQMESLRKLSYREKMEGKIGSMSAMVREAIDDYLKKKDAA